MVYTKNKLGNAVAFVISFAVHFGSAYALYFAASKDETLLAQKNEAPKMMAISLNQISPIRNDENSMQATKEQSAQAIVPPEPKPPEPLKEEPKIEPLKEEPKPPEPLKEEPPKPKKPPKPKAKPVEKKVVPKEPKPLEPLKEEPKVQPLKDEPKQEQTTLPSALPSSQSVANNEAVSQGGALVSGQSKSSDNAQARTILGEIHAAILKHKTYPKRAINSKMQGRAKVEFLLTAKCEFSKLEIIETSGHEFLDKHALHTIKRSCKDFPDGATGMDLKVVIAFDLKDVE